MSCPMTASDLSLPRTPVPAHLLLTQGATQPGQIFVMERVPHHDGPETDRKSTRLNSSHGYISYAVFCLKKKKEHQFLTLCGQVERVGIIHHEIKPHDFFLNLRVRIIAA